jgi:hypothetical protein
MSAYLKNSLILASASSILGSGAILCSQDDGCGIFRDHAEIDLSYEGTNQRVIEFLPRPCGDSPVLQTKELWSS